MFKRKKSPETSAQLANDDPNPYIANREEADDRNRNLAVDKHNWQVAFRLTAGLLAISMGFNGYYMVQSKLVPYVVATDSFGHVIAVGPADKANPIDSKRVLRAEMLDWVENVRAVIGDNLAQKRAIGKVYARVASTGRAKKMLDDYYRERKPFDTAQTMTASAEVKVALPTSPHTWQVEWTERWRNAEGQVVREENWKGLFTFEVTPLNTEDGIKLNPTGLFITDFTWSKSI
jgi:type IV secretory pathway TrbF-like protein